MPAPSASRQRRARPCAARGCRAAARAAGPRCWPGTAAGAAAHSMPASSAGLPLRDRVLDVRARDVVQRAPSSCPGCGTATPASRPRARRSPPCPRRLDDEAARGSCAGRRGSVITGWMSRSSGRNAPIAVLIDSPRPANAVAEALAGSPARPRACPRRTCSGTRRARPASRPARARSCRRPGKSRADLPRVISTYFRPSADRGRTSSVESFGSGPASLSSVSVRTAITRPLSSCFGLDLGDRADARAADLDVVADRRAARRSASPR